MKLFTIGLGLADANGKALKATRALECTLEVADLLEECGCSLLFQGTGTGQYTNEAGETFTEPSACFVFTIESEGALLPNGVPVLKALRAGLAGIALAFEQEAIALSEGHSELICPEAK